MKMSEEKQYWDSKTMYIGPVTGQEIAQTQETINSQKSKFVTATQWLAQTAQGSTTGKFYALIYYKELPQQNKPQVNEPALVQAPTGLSL